jgi:hypothetical protein
VDFVVRALAVGAVLAAAAAVAQATQGSCTFTDENGKVQTLPNCGIPEGSAPPVSPAAPGAAKSFPFPGDSSGTDTSSGSGSGLPAAPGSAEAPAQTPGNGGNPAVPATPGGDSNAPAGQRFPFPGENPSGAGAGSSAGGAKPAGAENPGGLQDAGSSGSSSSGAQGSDSSSSSSSNDSSSSDDSGVGPLAGDNDAAAKAAADRHRKKLPAAPLPQTDSAREQEDIKVAGFYQNDGDYKGAYDRSKDAVALADDDAEAHLALAEAARKLGKLDEAESNYKKCLTLDPVPKVKRAAEKALKEMQGGG